VTAHDAHAHLSVALALDDDGEPWVTLLLDPPGGPGELRLPLPLGVVEHVIEALREAQADAIRILANRALIAIHERDRRS
jgi:hypothetical protein